MTALFLEALNCRNQGARPPIWLMRQAGRHMASYRAMRNKYPFLTLCHQPELIAQATLLPIQAYEMDAAILFSDILLVVEALGLGLRFEESVGPIIEKPLMNQASIDRLPSPSDKLEAFQCVYEGIRLLKSQLRIPLIGFCGAPYTVASYLIEGKSSRDFKKTKQWMLSNPAGFHQLLALLADWSIAYLKLQIKAGVDAIQLFDSWAHTLAHAQFREFSLAYMQRILNGLKETNIPVILFCRGSSIFASQLAEIVPQGISLDWNCDITAMRNLIAPSIALQGNLDPDILYAPQATIEKEVNRLLDGMAGDPGYIFSLGHGLHPDTPEEAVRFLVELVKNRAACPAISLS